MNLAEQIIDRENFYMFAHSMHYAVVINGRWILPEENVFLKEEDIPFLKNMFLEHEYTLFKFERGGVFNAKTDRKSAIRFCELPVAIRDEIRKTVAHVGGDESITITRQGQ